MHLDEVGLGNTFIRIEKGKAQLYYRFSCKPTNVGMPWPSLKEFVVCQRISYYCSDTQVTKENLVTFKHSRAGKIRVFPIA